MQNINLKSATPSHFRRRNYIASGRSICWHL